MSHVYMFKISYHKFGIDAHVNWMPVYQTIQHAFSQTSDSELESELFIDSDSQVHSWNLSVDKVMERSAVTICSIVPINWDQCFFGLSGRAYLHPHRNLWKYLNL